MRKVVLVLTIVFVILTFAGGFYVLQSGGTESAGYAIIPMIFALACLGFYGQAKRPETEGKE